MTNRKTMEIIRPVYRSYWYHQKVYKRQPRYSEMYTYLFRRSIKRDKKEKKENSRK